MLITYKIPLKNLTFISIIVPIGLIFLLPQFLFEYKNNQLIQFNFQVILVTIYVVFFAGLAAYIFWNKGVSIIGPNKAGIFLHLMPIFSSFMAIFILNEKLMSFHIIGAVVIIVGIYLSSKKTLLK